MAGITGAAAFFDVDGTLVWHDYEKIKTMTPEEVQALPPIRPSRTVYEAFDRMREAGYRWWLDRLARACDLYDYVRLDHFLGFHNYYSIPAGQKGNDGRWLAGPGKELFDRAAAELGRLAQERQPHADAPRRTRRREGVRHLRDELRAHAAPVVLDGEEKQILLRALLYRYLDFRGSGPRAVLRYVEYVRRKIFKHLKLLLARRRAAVFTNDLYNSLFLIV